MRKYVTWALFDSSVLVFYMHYKVYLIRNMELFYFILLLIIFYFSLLFYNFRQDLQKGGEKATVCERSFSYVESFCFLKLADG